MGLEAHLASLTRAELLKLVNRVCVGLVDERDIASARWDAAVEESKRLEAVAADLAAKASALDAQCTHANSRENLKKLHERDQARHAWRCARAAADRGFRREQKRWDELEKFFIKDAK